MKKYYSLLEFYANQWAVVYGSFDKEEVLNEEREYYSDIETKIIVTDPSQNSIDAEVKLINQNKRN